MQSGDFVNEKIPAPDIMMPGSAINQQSGWNIGPQQGATRGQIDQVVPALSASSHLSNMVQSKDASQTKRLGWRLVRQPVMRFSSVMEIL